MTYDRNEALRDVSFEVETGEFFGVIGPNGSGKSTLLKILAGIYRGDAGEVVVHGRLSPFIELGVGFNEELSGADNVRINGTMLGLTLDEIDRRFDAIVSFAGLDRFIDQKLKNYSSGMRVRLAYSIAIQVEFDILLLDEVLAVGDQEFQEQVLRDAGRDPRAGEDDRLRLARPGRDPRALRPGDPVGRWHSHSDREVGRSRKHL